MVFFKQTNKPCVSSRKEAKKAETHTHTNMTKLLQGCIQWLYNREEWKNIFGYTIKNKEMNQEYIWNDTDSLIYIFMSFRTMYHIRYLMLTTIPQKLQTGSFTLRFYAMKNQVDQLVSTRKKEIASIFLLLWKNFVLFHSLVGRLCLYHIMSYFITFQKIILFLPFFS